MESTWVVVDKAGNILKEGTKNECAVYFMKHCGKVELTGSSNIGFCPKETYLKLMQEREGKT